MGLMDLKGKVNKTLFGNDVDSFSQGMQKERERNVIFDYETIARDSFELSEVAERRLEKLMSKKGKKADAVLEYLNGEKFYNRHLSKSGWNCEVRIQRKCRRLFLYTKKSMDVK